MADAPTIIIAAGGIHAANEVLFNRKPVPWKALIATGIGALIFAGFQSVDQKVAVLLASVVLVGALIVTPSGEQSLATNLANWAGGK